MGDSKSDGGPFGAILALFARLKQLALIAFGVILLAFAAPGVVVFAGLNWVLGAMGFGPCDPETTMWGVVIIGVLTTAVAWLVRGLVPFGIRVLGLLAAAVTTVLVFEKAFPNIQTQEAATEAAAKAAAPLQEEKSIFDALDSERCQGLENCRFEGILAHPIEAVFEQDRAWIVRDTGTASWGGYHEALVTKRGGRWITQVEVEEGRLKVRRSRTGGVRDVVLWRRGAVMALKWNGDAYRGEFSPTAARLMPVDGARRVSIKGQLGRTSYSDDEGKTAKGSFVLEADEAEFCRLASLDSPHLEATSAGLIEVLPTLEVEFLNWQGGPVEVEGELYLFAGDDGPIRFVLKNGKIVRVIL